MRRVLWASLLLLCTAVPAMAQVPAAASYDLNIYAAGGTTPQTRNVLAASVVCNTTAPVPTTLNPLIWYWKNASGLWCRVDDATRLTALADGSYEGTVIPVNSQGLKGPESSPRSPFTRQRPLPPPAAVTDVQFSL